MNIPKLPLLFNSVHNKIKKEKGGRRKKKKKKKKKTNKSEMLSSKVGFFFFFFFFKFFFSIDQSSCSTVSFYMFLLPEFFFFFFFFFPYHKKYIKGITDSNAILETSHKSKQQAKNCKLAISVKQVCGEKEGRDTRRINEKMKGREGEKNILLTS